MSDRKTGKRLDIKIGYGCNNHCLFCVQGKKREECLFRKKTLIKKDIIKAKKHCDSVVFTGGEPTIHPDFIELVEAAKNAGFKQIQIQTNGRMFAYKNFCEKTIKAGANEFSPALHGHTAALHDKLTSAPKSFEQAVKGIRNLKALSQKIITNTVVTKLNYRFLPDVAKLLVNLGVDQFQFAFVHIVGSAWENRGSIVPKMSRAMPYIKKSLNIGISAGKKVMTEGIPYCLMKNYEEYIAEQYIPEAMVIENKFKIPNFGLYRVNKAKARGPKCTKCRYYNICEGPWKEYPEIFGWSEFKPVKKQK